MKLTPEEFMPMLESLLPRTWYSFHFDKVNISVDTD